MIIQKQHCEDLLQVGLACEKNKNMQTHSKLCHNLTRFPVQLNVPIIYLIILISFHIFIMDIRPTLLEVDTLNPLRWCFPNLGKLLRFGGKWCSSSNSTQTTTGTFKMA